MQQSEHPAWTNLCDSYARNGYDALSNEYRLWLNVRSLIDSAENGALISYYFNSGADHLADCMTALRALGATSALEAIEDMNRRFPDGLVPTDIDARNAIISSWADTEKVESALAAIDRRFAESLPDLEQRLLDYLKRIGI
jgi:hypothetical protein